MLGLGLNLTSITAALLDFVRSGLKMWLPFERSEILGENLTEGYDFTSGWGNTGNVTINDADTFTTSVADRGIYKSYTTIGKIYKLTVVGTTTSSTGIKITDGSFGTMYYENSSSGSFSDTVIFPVASPSNTDIFIRNKSTGETTITTLKVEEVTQIAPDKSTNNSNNATLYTGKALSFDGVNDYVDLGSQSMPNTSAATFAFWCNPTLTSSTGDRAVIRYGKSNVWFHDNNEMQIYPDIAGSPAQFTSLSDPSGKYQRFVVTISGTTTKLYIDGTLIGSATTPAISTTASASYIGQFDTNKFLPAKLSDVQLYDVAWTQADVTFDYDNPQHLVTDNSASSIALSNLKGYWHFSEGAGAINYDSSGEDNNGTINGATWSLQQPAIPQLGLMDWSKPTIGSDVVTLISDPNDPSEDILGNDVRLREHSLNLDGSGYAQVADDDSLDFGTGAFSIDGWAKYTFVNSGSSTGNAIYSNGGTTTASSNNFAIATHTTGGNRRLRFYINGEDLNFDITSNVSDGAWFYFAGTRDASGNFKLYINDLTAESQSQTGNSGATVTTTNVRYIGRDGGVNRYYKNLIDDIRLYNRELSSDEVAQNYNAGLSQHKPGSAFSDDFSSDYGL